MGKATLNTRHFPFSRKRCRATVYLIYGPLMS